MISCQDADVLAAALSVGSIDTADQASLQLHLAGCAECRVVAGQYMAAAARLPLALEPVQPPPELRGRLMRAVYTEAEAARSGRRPATDAAPWWRRLWVVLPASRGLTMAAAGAAVVLIGLSSWALATRGASSSGPVAVALSATLAAPQAHGELTWDRSGDQAVITVSGLPSPAALARNDAVYEVWLIRSNGTVLPATYLTRNPDGTWSAALRADVSAYSGVAATAEPEGGSMAPTGAKVFTGSLSTS